MRMENPKAGRKGNLNVATEVSEKTTFTKQFENWRQITISDFFWKFNSDLIFGWQTSGFSNSPVSSRGWAQESKGGYSGVPKGTSPEQFSAVFLKLLSWGVELVVPKLTVLYNSSTEVCRPNWRMLCGSATGRSRATARRHEAAS